MSKSKIINVQGQDITITQIKDEDYISLTDMVKGEEGSDHIRNWMRNRNTVEFLGLWETLNNEDFKGVEFDTLRKQAGLNSFNLTPRKWIDTTQAKGLISISGKNGGTYAHKDIAFEFGSWLNPIFKLYLIKEFQRLKAAESSAYNLDWNIKRVLSKANYQIHTAAVKEYRVPLEKLPKEKEGILYADEAEILNYAVFGFSSKAWRDENPDLVLKGHNLREYASINELAVLSNMESVNAVMLGAGVDRGTRMKQLRIIAQKQLTALASVDYEKSYKRVKDGSFQPLLPNTHKKNNDPKNPDN